MLIDTNQLISLMDLRTKAGDYIQRANQGVTFYITDKGRLMAMLSPVKTSDNKQRAFEKMNALIKRANDLKFTDNRDSTIIIREMRDTRYGD